MDYHRPSSVLDAFPEWLLFLVAAFMLIMSGYYLWNTMSGKLPVRYGLLGIGGMFVTVWLFVSGVAS